jgi:hypothetical protein
MEQNNQPVYITLSLPSGKRGETLKNAIREVAKYNQRSVSNQCVQILQDFLERVGKIHQHPDGSFEIPQAPDQPESQGT